MASAAGQMEQVDLQVQYTHPFSLHTGTGTHTHTHTRQCTQLHLFHESLSDRICILHTVGADGQKD